jgi:hypothetical protein
MQIHRALRREQKECLLTEGALVSTAGKVEAWSGNSGGDVVLEIAAKSAVGEREVLDTGEEGSGKSSV